METKELTTQTLQELVELFIDIIGYAVEVSISFNEKDELFNVDITGENLGVLIGYHGKNIASIEYILNVLATRKFDITHYISLDINGYRKSRYEIIAKYTLNIIKKVLLTRQSQALYAMTSSERLYVHKLISGYPDLETQSSGDEPNRFVTIKIKS